ncbi:hypothetical protein AAFF_G00007060 [Aldrovandia affinis]|uniref:Uncharacterized protein n=1 Tax=Aldrovandia affinis TaxID=143900 RepID=A0AAD7T6R3_9TELE|nr:hypothetical protein AAFF_G00007060 [Aldrovandia affinis]
MSPAQSKAAEVIDCDACFQCTFPVACQADAGWQARPTPDSSHAAGRSRGDALSDTDPPPPSRARNVIPDSSRACTPRSLCACREVPMVNLSAGC